MRTCVCWRREASNWNDSKAVINSSAERKRIAGLVRQARSKGGAEPDAFANRQAAMPAEIMGQRPGLVALRHNGLAGRDVVGELPD